MSIESSGATASPQASAGPQGLSGHGKAGKPGAAPGPTGGGFLALMASFETEAGAGVPAGALSAAGAADQEDANGALLATDAVLSSAGPPPMDPLIASAPTLPTDLAMLLAQAGAAGVNKAGTGGDDSPAASSGQLVAAAIVVAAPPPSAATFIATGPEQPAALAPGAQVVSAVPDGQREFGNERGQGAKAEVRSTVPAVRVDKREKLLALSDFQGSEQSADLRRTVEASLEQAAQALPARTQKALTAELQSGVRAAVAESRALRASFLVEAPLREPALLGALAASGAGDSMVRQAERPAAKLAALSGSYGSEGSWGAHALLAGNRVDAPSATLDASTLSLESMVADTVSYWVTQGVQSAELTLDGFGGETVEVRISLKGDEAHIGFRTDQPEIRQILEGATAHLKDLLTSEGLVLSGVSVGGSGQEGAGAQEQRNRPAARQAVITAADTVPADSPKRVSQTVGRAVDLFV